MTKFLTQPQNAYKSAIYKRKKRFLNCIPNRKQENQISETENEIKEGRPIWIYTKIKSTTPKTKTKK